MYLPADKHRLNSTSKKITQDYSNVGTFLVERERPMALRLVSWGTCRLVCLAFTHWTLRFDGSFLKPNPIYMPDQVNRNLKGGMAFVMPTYRVTVRRFLPILLHKRMKKETRKVKKGAKEVYFSSRVACQDRPRKHRCEFLYHGLLNLVFNLATLIQRLYGKVHVCKCNYSYQQYCSTAVYQQSLRKIMIIINIKQRMYVKNCGTVLTYIDLQN